jgi:hypothetical protein
MFKFLSRLSGQTKILESKTQNLFTRNNFKRNFSNVHTQPPNYNKIGSWALIGAGAAGLMYLLLYGRSLAHAQYTMPLHQVQQMHFFHPMVQYRIRQCLMYFGGGLGLTGILVGSLRNSMFAYTVNPWILLFGSLGLLIGTQLTDYHSNAAVKHLLWFGFLGTMSLSMVPLINMASMPIIYDALFATGITMGGLGLIAYNAPSE